MNVVFYQRNYSQRSALTIPVTVERYSWDMIGGPHKAYLTVPAHPEMWDLTRLLRCPVEIYSGDGRLNWWGYVNKVVIPHGEQRVGLGLDTLANYVTCTYDGGTTTDAQNATSILEYGQKEMVLTDLEATQTQAERARDTYLEEFGYAHPEVEFSGGRDTVQIECYGWYQSLEWKYYTNAGTSDVEHTTQIAAMVTDCGQFLRGTVIEDIASLTSSEERDGTQMAIRLVDELLGAGTSNARPLLATVDKDRYLHVYERSAETTEYLLLEDGNLVTALNLEVPASYCVCAAWVQVKNVPTTAAKSATGMRPFFIESSEYDAQRDRTTYRVAGAFEQNRLSKYVRQETRPKVPETYPPPFYPASGITDYAAIAFTNATQVYTVSSGIALTDYSPAGSTGFHDIGFTPSVSGLYMVGASIHDNGGGAAINAAVKVLGVANYDTNLTKTGGMSETLTTEIYASVSVADYILSTQAVRVNGVMSNNIKADDFFMFVVRLM